MHTSKQAPRRRIGRFGRCALALTAAATLAVGLAACGSSSGSGGAKTLTIQSLWGKSAPEGKPFYAAVARWEKQTGNTAKVTEAGENLSKIHETNVAANKEADLVIVNLAGTTPGWVKNGYAEPVGQYLDAWGIRDKLQPEAIKEWTVDGKVVGFPYAGFTWPVMYNMALLNRAGITTIPTSTDQLISDAAKLNAAGVAPVVIGGNDWSGEKLFYQLIQSYLPTAAATTLFEKGGYCANQQAMQGIDLFDRLRDAKVFAKGSQGLTADQMNSLFYAQKAAIMSAGNWAFDQTPAPVVRNVQMGGFPIPAGGTFSKPTAYEGFTGSGFWISPKGKDKLSLIESFVKSMYTPQTLNSFQSQAGTVLAAKTSSTAATGAHPLLVKAQQTLPAAVQYAVFPDTTVPANAQDAVIRATSQAYIPGTSANTTCKALDQAYSGS